MTQRVDHIAFNHLERLNLRKSASREPPVEGKFIICHHNSNVSDNNDWYISIFSND